MIFEKKISSSKIFFNVPVFVVRHMHEPAAASGVRNEGPGESGPPRRFRGDGVGRNAKRSVIVIFS